MLKAYIAAGVFVVVDIAIRMIRIKKLFKKKRNNVCFYRKKTTFVNEITERDDEMNLSSFTYSFFFYYYFSNEVERGCVCVKGK